MDLFFCFLCWSHSKLGFVPFLVSILVTLELHVFFPPSHTHAHTSHSVTVNQLMMVDFDSFWGSSPSVSIVKLPLLLTVYLMYILLYGNHRRASWIILVSFLPGLHSPYFGSFSALLSICWLPLFLTLSVCMLTNVLSASAWWRVWCWGGVGWACIKQHISRW